MPVISKLPQAMAQLDRIMLVRTRRIVAQYEANLQRLFRLAHSGIIYKRGSKTHQASAPGEAPAIDTGGMSQNIAHDVKKIGEARYRARVGVTKVIPISRVLALELGKLDGTLKKRPAWVPAIRMLRKQMKELLAKG